MARWRKNFLSAKTAIFYSTTVISKKIKVRLANLKIMKSPNVQNVVLSKAKKGDNRSAIMLKCLYIAKNKKILVIT